MKKLLTLLLIITMTVLTGCMAKESSNTFFAMDTPMTISCSGKNSKKAVEEATAFVNLLDEKLSYNKKTSDVYKINNATNEEVWTVTSKIIQKAVEYSEFTGGYFDITIGKLKSLWNIEGESNIVPDESSIKKALKTVSYKNISVDGETVYTTNECNIDLGAIAKGYASDAVFDIFEKNQIKNGLINLGGNIYAKGKNNNSLWKIGIKDPRGGENDIVGYVEVKDKAVVTSGDYQRYFEKGGKRYCHIINPKTGESVDNDLMSVTIIDSNGTKADAVSTAVFVLGYEKGLDFCNKNDIEAIFIKKDKNIIVTENLKSNFKLTEKSYSYEN